MISGRSQSGPGLESSHPQRGSQAAFPGQAKQRNSPRLPDPEKRASVSPVSRSYSHQTMAPPQPNIPRTNRYFLPGDGIRREIITRDICRFLGNDALVKPGSFEDRDGFWITAYRALTTDMIADLKAESAKLDMQINLDGPSGQYKPSTRGYPPSYGPSGGQTRPPPPPHSNQEHLMDRPGGPPYPPGYYDYPNPNIHPPGYVAGPYPPPQGFPEQDYQSDPNLESQVYYMSQPRTTPPANPFPGPTGGEPAYAPGPYPPGPEQYPPAYPPIPPTVPHTGYPVQTSLPTTSAPSAFSSRPNHFPPPGPPGRDPYGGFQ